MVTKKQSFSVTYLGRGEHGQFSEYGLASYNHNHHPGVNESLDLSIVENGHNHCGEPSNNLLARISP